MPDLGWKISKKVKNVILASLKANTCREREKNLVMSTVSTQPELEHSQKKVKNFQKFKKGHSGFVSSQTRPGQAEKEIKKFSFRILFLPNPGGSIPKKIVKN